MVKFDGKERGNFHVSFTRNLAGDGNSGAADAANFTAGRAISIPITRVVCVIYSRMADTWLYIGR